MDHLSGAALAALMRPHAHFPLTLGIEWWLCSAGLTIQGASPKGTPGTPETATRVFAWFGPEMRAAAVEFGVPVELIAATICTESAGGQPDREKVIRARRQEPGWINDERTPHRVSMGVMQTLISTARMALDDQTITAERLCDPATAIRAGTAYIASQADETGFDPPLVAAAYNAGSLREDRARTNPWRLVCYPLGTGKHIERAVAYLNDIWKLAVADPSLIGEAPSLVRAVRAASPQT